MSLFYCLLVTHISQMNPEGFKSSAISTPQTGCWDSVKGQINSSLQIKVTENSCKWTSWLMPWSSVSSYYMLLCFSDFLPVLQEIFQIFSSFFKPKPLPAVFHSAHTKAMTRDLLSFSIMKPINWHITVLSSLQIFSCSLSGFQDLSVTLIPDDLRNISFFFTDTSYQVLNIFLSHH